MRILSALLISCLTLVGTAQPDSTCMEAFIVLETGIFGSEVSFDISDANGNVVFVGNDPYISNQTYTYVTCLSQGCYLLNMYDSFGDGWNGGTFSLQLLDAAGTFIQGGLDDGEFGFIEFGVDSDSCNTYVAGCTDSLAFNYDPLANWDNGLCQYPCDASFSYTSFNNASMSFSIDNASNGQQVDWDFGDGTSTVGFNAGVNVYHQFNSVGTYYVCATVYNDFCTDTYCDTLTTPEVHGCTDTTATNYNPWATIDDGSCSYPLICDSNQVMTDFYVCVFNNGLDVGFELVADNGDIVYSQMGYDDMAIEYFSLCLDEGVCYTANMYNLDLSGDTGLGWYNGYWWANVNGAQIMTESLDDNLDFETAIFSVDGTCGEVYGCTDSTAINFDPNATIDNGTCYWPVANDLCADATPLSPGTIAISNEGAYTNEGIWGDCWNSGSGEGEQTSIWYSFTTPSYPAHINIEALYDGTNTLTDTQFGVFESCGGDMIACDGNSGQGLMSMLDFECGELAENTTYLLIIDGYFGDEGTAMLAYSVDTICGGQAVYGCTDSFALNYDPLANIDDGSCIYPSDSCDYNAATLVLVTGAFGNEVEFDVTDENGNVIVSGDNFVSNSTYVFDACVEDGCYTLTMEDTFGDGWNGAVATFYLNGDIIGSATLPSGSYGTYVFGVNEPDCQDSTLVLGCTDPLAMNYNPAATIDDGSCYYGPDSTDCEAYFEVVDVVVDSSMVVIWNQSSGNDLSYYWNFGDGNSSNEEFPFHTYSTDGTYLICLTVFNSWGCQDMYCDTITYINPPIQGGGSGFNGFHINVTPPTVTSIDANVLDENALTLFPNPAAEMLNVRFDGDIAGLSFSVMDMSGRTVLTQRMSSAFEEIDVSGLSEGMYMLLLQSENGLATKRFNVLR